MRRVEPLLWMDPPFAIVQRIYHEARRAVPNNGVGLAVDPIIGKQYWLRKVSAEFTRRLIAYDIAVEGLTW